MRKVTGRTDDMMIIRGVNVFPTQIEELVLTEPGLAPYFQGAPTQPGNMTRADRRRGDAHPSVRRGQELGRADLRHQIKNRIGTTATVEVREPGGIERSVGKARRIVDRRIPAAPQRPRFPGGPHPGACRRRPRPWGRPATVPRPR